MSADEGHEAWSAGGDRQGQRLRPTNYCMVTAKRLQGDGMTRGQPPDGTRLTGRELAAALARVRQGLAALDAQPSAPPSRLLRLAWHLHDGFSLLSPEGVHLDVNPAFCAMVGFAREELVGVGPPHPFWPPEERASISRALDRGMRGTMSSVEATFMRKDGERFPALITTQLIRDEADTPVCVFATIKDMSEQRRAEAALRESESHYRAIVENAPIGAAQSTSAGLLVYGNGALAAIFGYDSPQELLAEVNRRSLGEVLYEDRADRAEFVRRVHAGGDAWTTFESRMRRKDGAVINVLLHFCERAAPNSAERYLYGFVQDVTERVQADEALREREGRLRGALDDTVAALGATVAMRDPYTAGHERRVAELVGLLTERLGWNGEAIATMRLAALVHDIGKIAVPAQILAKPARLTDVEFDLVKEHPRAAYDILAAIDFGGPVAGIVLQHHERLDGSGYPQGLAAAQILLEARVLAVADVVEAMISHRPYRAALSVDAAAAELEDGAGRRYDAAVCEEAIRLLGEPGFALSD